MLQSHTVDLDGVPLHYVEAAGPGPALLLIHGITGFHTTYMPLLAALAQQAHVYALDLRGHGLSGHTPGAYQVPDYGRDVAAFVQTVVGRPAVVAAHSLGGLIAVWLAGQAPAWVDALLLEDPPLYITQPPRLQQTPFYGYFLFLRDHLHRHHANGGTLEDMVASVGQMPANETQTMLEAAGPARVRQRASELQHMDPAVLDPAIDGVILGSHEPDGLLVQVRCPTHLLAAQTALGGAMDGQDVQRFVATLPHCTHTVFPDAGHGIHEERPEEYVRALEGVLRLAM